MILKPLRKRLEEAARLTQTRLDIIQQDYILSWLLVGIFQHPHLASTLVFKGGTSLKKCFFGQYRFSEDLDFSAIQDAPRGESLLRAISEACKTAEQLINEYAPIRMDIKRYEEKEPHPHQQEAFVISAQFPWQSQPLTKTMIEISYNEIILLPPTENVLLHTYGESIDQNVRVYSLEEIVLEKLRAILQHTKKLHERDWCRSRARDYYDLWRIFQSFEKQLVFERFVDLLQEKCVLKQVNFHSADAFFEPVMIDSVLQTWQKWLGPLVPELPNCEMVLNDLKTTIDSLLSTGLVT